MSFFLSGIGLKILIGVLVVGLVTAMYFRWRGAQRAIGAAIEKAEQKGRNKAIRKAQDAIKAVDPSSDIDTILAGM